MRFLVSSTTAPVSSFLLSPQLQQNAFPSSMISVLGRGKNSVRGLWWLKHDYGFVFRKKHTHKHRRVSWCVIMVQNPQFCAFLTKCFAQSVHNFKVVFLNDRTTLWQEFTMHHAIAIEENSEQNLHICRNLTCFFRSWLFWTLSLGWLGFGFTIMAIPPLFDTS